MEEDFCLIERTWSSSEQSKEENLESEIYERECQIEAKALEKSMVTKTI